VETNVRLALGSRRKQSRLNDFRVAETPFILI
jgi:hypothetical protein